MFENASQEILFIGYVGRYAVVPAIKVIAGIFMAISVYRDAKSRNFDNKWFWSILAFFSPILGRIAYAVYHRYIRKKIWDIEYPKVLERKGVVLMVLSFTAYGLMLMAMLVSMITIGVSKVKSKIDNEPIVIYYDIQGNQYGKAWKVPLYDRDGNTYKYELKAFDICYTDQNGKSYASEQCYIDGDGYFIYDEEDAFVSISENMDYYKDAEGNIYYSVSLLPVYWSEDGDTFVMVWKNIGFEIFTEEDFVSNDISRDFTDQDVSNTYSRDYVNDICSAWGFGDGSLDDTYIVAQYIYSSEEFENLYGENFAIEYISGSAEFESGFNGKQGTSYCRAHIGEDIWEFNLIIDYGEDWRITDYHLEETGDELIWQKFMNFQTEHFGSLRI